MPAGNVLAIAGLGQAILKSATLAWSPLARPLAPQLFQATPIVRVAVEPVDPADVGRLAAGLALLGRADPMVRVEERENGEHVVCAAGEVHLETCVKDLETRFARCKIIVSAPLVAFRESLADAACLANAPTAVTNGVPTGTANPLAPGVPGGFVVEATTPTGACLLRVRAFPLPASLASTLDKELEGVLDESIFTPELAQQLIKDDEPEIKTILRQAWALGPRSRGPNILLCSADSLLWSIPEHSIQRRAKARPGSAPGVRSEESGNVEDEQPEPETVSTPLSLGKPQLAEMLGLAAKQGNNDNKYNGDSEDGPMGVEGQARKLGITSDEFARIQDRYLYAVCSWSGRWDVQYTMFKERLFCSPCLLV